MLHSVVLLDSIQKWIRNERKALPSSQTGELGVMSFSGMSLSSIGVSRSVEKVRGQLSDSTINFSVKVEVEAWLDKVESVSIL